MWRLRTGLLACFVASVVSAEPVFLDPDTAVCLQHLRAGEKARAEKALGPLEALPLYRVELEVDPTSRSVEGKMELDHWVGQHPLSEVFLQMTPNAQTPGRVSLVGVTANGRPVQPQSMEPSLVRIALDPPAAPGTLVRVHATFRALVPHTDTNPLGAMASEGGRREPTDYGAFGAAGRAMSLVGIIPREPPLRANGSPRDGPSGLGDLALYDPAHLKLVVRVPSGYEVEATGIEMGKAREGGRVRYTFAAAIARDFPIFVTHGYEMLPARVGDVTVSVHFAPEHADAGQRVLDYTTSALEVLERRLGRQPFNRFRIVEAPLGGGAGGMEFPGLISISANLMAGGTGMLDQLGIPEDMLPMVKELLATTSSLNQVVENTLEFTVAHEVAHQYFAELVGSDPIVDPAVDETLAQYTALLYLEWKQGKPAAQAMRNGQVVAAYQLYRMMGGEDGPVERPTSGFSSSLQYAALVYGKGPMLHEAERQLMGDGPFFAGLRRYVDEYRFRWACNDCLTRTLAQQSPSHAQALWRLRRHWWVERHGDDDLGSLDAMAKSLQGQPVDGRTQELMNQMLNAFQQ